MEIRHGVEMNDGYYHAMLSYLDGATGGMLVAAFAGGLSGFGVLLKMYGHRIAGVFSKKHRAEAQAARAQLLGETDD